MGSDIEERSNLMKKKIQKMQIFKKKQSESAFEDK